MPLFLLQKNAKIPFMKSITIGLVQTNVGENSGVNVKKTISRIIKLQC